MKMWFVLLFCNKIGDSVLAIFSSSILNPHTFTNARVWTLYCFL